MGEENALIGMCAGDTPVHLRGLSELSESEIERLVTSLRTRRNTAIDARKATKSLDKLAMTGVDASKRIEAVQTKFDKQLASTEKALAKLEGLAMELKTLVVIAEGM